MTYDVFSADDAECYPLQIHRLDVAVVIVDGAEELMAFTKLIKRTMARGYSSWEVLGIARPVDFDLRPGGDLGEDFDSETNVFLEAVLQVVHLIATSAVSGGAFLLPRWDGRSALALRAMGVAEAALGPCMRLFSRASLFSLPPVSWERPK
ncbi:hypothetical protein ACHAXT_003727 [Thalassiosira profunda]